MARGDQTRAAILAAALRLFREQGYDRTTMRGIAQEASLSPGNAYYYFRSKDQLVQEFYREICDEHRRQSAEVLATRRTLATRLRGVLHAGVDVMAPYHEFAGSFIKVAIEAGAPSSPFSPESAPAREIATGVFRDVVDGSKTTVDSRLRDALPELLWLAYLGVTLFWVYDSSPGQRRTRALIDRGAPLLARLVGLARLPVLRTATREALALLAVARS